MQDGVRLSERLRLVLTVREDIVGEEPSELLGGYYIERDQDVLTLHQVDGSLVAAFSNRATSGLSGRPPKKPEMERYSLGSYLLRPRSSNPSCGLTSLVASSFCRTTRSYL